jgi:hypothetical protein
LELTGATLRVPPSGYDLVGSEHSVSLQIFNLTRSADFVRAFHVSAERSIRDQSAARFEKTQRIVNELAILNVPIRADGMRRNRRDKSARYALSLKGTSHLLLGKRAALLGCHLLFPLAFSKAEPTSSMPRAALHCSIQILQNFIEVHS